ncbi:hypothetical protein BDW02DRAFT_573936 [Decorospora gaudefroyi]|uniref:Uncharacterized protein n=1 Tax=Decorospora gaudefroyi TaxID=184978 RepID=A0A6A5K809_9PLEO|nr:hypothetical protein BDW02DRAFT_573936 [Decorospora gaudefroyi]
MSSLGDMQRQVSQVLGEAKAQGYKIEDVISEEMQDHFQVMAELKTAREYIREAESREQDLRVENASLFNKLKEKETEIEDQPAEFKALKVDLQQAHRSIDCYKLLADDSQRRAERYQHKLAVAIKDQVDSDALRTKVDRLQTELEQHQTTILRLQDENRKTAEMFDSLQTKLVAVQAQASVVESESEEFSETFAALIDTLERENSSVAASLNNKTMLLQKTETLYNMVASEVTPLNSFCNRAVQMLRIYQGLFQHLSDTRAMDIADLPQKLDDLIAGAVVDLHLYEGIHDTLSGPGGVAEEKVRMELNGIFTSAGEMLGSFNRIKADVVTFLERLHSEPTTWFAMRAKFGMTGKRYSLR